MLQISDNVLTTYTHSLLLLHFLNVPAFVKDQISGNLKHNSLVTCLKFTGELFESLYRLIKEVLMIIS